MSIEEKLQSAIIKSLGIEVAVRTDPHTVVVGKIKQAWFAEWRNRGKSRIAVFKVKIVAGPKEVEHFFKVERLPFKSEQLKEGTRPEIRSVDYRDEVPF
jgi:hypothetical protein